EPPATQAGAPAAQAGAAEAAARPPGGRSWFVLPVAFWLPETKLGAAVAAGIHFHVAKGAGDSNAFLVAGYTMLGQGTVDLDSDVLLKGGTLLTGRLRFAYYPDFFYGIGPTTSVDQKESQTRRFAEAIFTAEVPIVRGLRAGPRVHARAERISEATPGGLVATGRVPGADGFDALGLGAQVTWDSRDNPLWTTHGAYVEAWYLRYPASLGRNAGFYRGSGEARYFLSLGHGPVLGLAALLEHADSATPFSIMPKIGSTRYLRGIRDGRYRDAIAWAAQAELRVPFWERYAATLFGAFGDVTPSLGKQRADTLKVAGGAGLRYRLTDQGANLRLDVALSGVGGVEFYVLLLEAF
ncbi:MAG TPA: hypothetical protein VF841_00010, partial [Anaeromyxobacter sp.]